MSKRSIHVRKNVKPMIFKNLKEAKTYYAKLLDRTSKKVIDTLEKEFTSHVGTGDLKYYVYIDRKNYGKFNILFNIDKNTILISTNKMRAPEFSSSKQFIYRDFIIEQKNFLTKNVTRITYNLSELLMDKIYRDLKKIDNLYINKISLSRGTNSIEVIFEY